MNTRGRLRFLLPTLIVVVLELSLGNLSFWAGLFHHSQALSVGVSASSGFTRTGENTFEVTDPDDAVLAVDLPDDASAAGLDLSSIDLDLSSANPHSRFGLGAVYRVSPLVRSEGNMAGAQSLGVATVIEGLSDTHRLSVHPQGVVHDLSLKFTHVATGESVTVESVVLNASAPFSIHPVRTLLVLLVVNVVVALWPTRRSYVVRLVLARRRDLVPALVWAVLVALTLVVITQIGRQGQFFHMPVTGEGGAVIRDEDQANHYANAILSGHLWLDLPVPSWLTQMDNPYDASTRVAHSLQTGEPTYWDYAFHDGHYYSYFGILPILVLFVPFKALTGADLRTDYAVALLSCLLVVAAFFLTYQTLRRYWERASVGHWTLFSLVLIGSAGAVNQAFLPKIYSLPVLSSLVVTFVGLGAWLFASRIEAGRKSTVCLTCGAFLIALNLGGRPLFVLTAFFGLAIFAGALRERFGTRERLCDVAAVTVPFLVVGAATMWLNVARFSSPFDFGAKYNLTGFDMVHKPMVPARLGETLWMYFLQPVVLQPNFPFLKTVDTPSGILGLTVQEPYYGGVLAFQPVLVLLILAVLVWRDMGHRRWCFSSLVVYAVLVATVDGLMVSYTMRYQSDFAWCLTLALMVLLGEVWRRLHVGGDDISDSLITMRASVPRLEERINVIILVLSLLGIGLTLLNVLSTERYGALFS